MKKHKISTSVYLLLAALFIFGATFIAIIITQGGLVTDSGVKTNNGILRITIDPADTVYSMFIDDMLVTNMVNKGTNVEAGVHTIRISAEGMNDWEKKISITKGVVSDLYIKLFPLKLNQEQITNSNISNVSFSTSGEYVFYAIKNEDIKSDNGIWRLRLDQNSLFFLNSQSKPIKFAKLDDEILNLLGDSAARLIPSPDNNKLLLISPTLQQIYLINNLNSNETIKGIDIVSELGFFPAKIDWLNDSLSLIVDEGNTIFEYDLTTKRSTLIKYIPQENIKYDFNSYHVIWFDPNKKMLNQYKNQTNLTINQFIGLDLNQLESIYVPKNSQKYVLIKTNIDYYLLDLVLTKILPLNLNPIENLLIGISADASTYLFKNLDNKILSFVIKENLALEKVESKIYEFPIMLNEIDKVQTAPTGSNILIYKPQENAIYSFDQDGTNMITLINSVGLTPNFSFDNRLESLYLLINDGTSLDAAPGVNSNLYKINLRLVN